MTSLTRRRFVWGAGAAGLGLLVGCVRLPWEAEPRAARIGYLATGQGPGPSSEAFRQGLRDWGWIEGQNIVIEGRWAGARLDRLPALATELVRLQPDVLVATSTPATQAAMQATSTIPIVMVNVSDPLGLGLVPSLARPDGNVTGLSNLAAGLSGKRLELLKEAVPGAARVAALWNPTSANSVGAWRETQDAARTLGIEMQSVEVHGADELVGAFEIIARERPDALVRIVDPLTSISATPELPDLIRLSRLPTMHPVRRDVEAGGLMAYGPSETGLARRAAYYVDRILKGAKPADLPVEQPREFDFVINLQTTRALGLTVPHHVLLQATEIIQ
ncbi:MAG TPA: ABC transporter substrate-binding protein [Chloroflexota bacterium]|jgi:putative ABC transport system substrate-binding protein